MLSEIENQETNDPVHHVPKIHGTHFHVCRVLDLVHPRISVSNMFNPYASSNDELAVLASAALIIGKNLSFGKASFDKLSPLKTKWISLSY